MIRNAALGRIGIALAVTMLSSPVISAVVSEAVSSAADSSLPTSYIELLLSFDNDLDVAALKVDAVQHNRTRTQEYRNVMSRLVSNRADLEKALRPQLEAFTTDGRIKSYRFFTVSKTVLIESRVDNIEALRQLPNVRLINLNSPVSLVAPVEERIAAAPAAGSLANAGLETINVRPLWTRGLIGAGRLICSFDTGIDGDHPALGPKWRGNHGGSLAASWFAPHGEPMPIDKAGHGTHVMGILLGSANVDTVGVAPGAQWISAAVIDQGVNFSTTIADILSAFDWALDPDGDPGTTDDVPDVICNSWGVPKGVYAPCDNTFWTAIDNVEAAGIVTIFAAGNEGPGPQTIRTPADRGTSPINALSVGAIDPATLVIANFSSRGPANCDPSIIKPEVVAPGVGIYSSSPDGGYKIMSGTSMAAPFIAGLVALMRQYNPEATVEQIKQALLAATIDLGPVGEDNSYGRGVVDAGRLLDFLPPPPTPPQVAVVGHQIVSGGDGFADPGETAEVALTLGDPSGVTDSLDVWLSSRSSQLIMAPDTVRFRFADGTTFAVGTEPFRVTVATDAISGQSLDLVLHLRSYDGFTDDSIIYPLPVGHPLPGRLYSASSGVISFTVSDFGQFGLGTGSIYQAGGDGFRLGSSDNLLFEAGLVAGRNGFLVSDALRDESGAFKESDFAPGTAAALTGSESGQRLESQFSDSRAMLPLPIDVRQNIYCNGDDYVLLEFEVSNPTPERIDKLSYGLFFDFDLNRFSDDIGFDTALGMIYQFNSFTSRYVGVLGVSPNEFGFAAGVNDMFGKRGFTKQEKYNLVNQAGVAINGSGPADWYFTVSANAYQMEAFGRQSMAVALVAGDSPEAIRLMAERAQAAYGGLTGVDDDRTALPSVVELHQNYPNPFNPSTTIRFALKGSGPSILAVYNITGQRVRTLVDRVLPAGEHSVIWDGRDEAGAEAASGLYFYRLTTSGQELTRKMVLLK